MAISTRPAASVATTGSNRSSRRSPSSENSVRVSPEKLYELPDAMRSEQELFRGTGGCHAAGTFDDTRTVIAVREDLGRHSAFDKLLGYALPKRSTARA